MCTIITEVYKVYGGGAAGPTCYPLMRTEDYYTGSVGTCEQGEAGRDPVDPALRIFNAATTLPDCIAACYANI